MKNVRRACANGNLAARITAAVGTVAVLEVTMAAMVQEAVALPTCGTVRAQAIIALMVVLLQSNLVA